MFKDKFDYYKMSLIVIEKGEKTYSFERNSIYLKDRKRAHTLFRDFLNSPSCDDEFLEQCRGNYKEKPDPLNELYVDWLIEAKSTKNYDMSEFFERDDVRAIRSKWIEKHMKRTTIKLGHKCWCTVTVINVDIKTPKDPLEWMKDSVFYH